MTVCLNVIERLTEHKVTFTFVDKCVFGEKPCLIVKKEAVAAPAGLIPIKCRLSEQNPCSYWPATRGVVTLRSPHVPSGVAVEPWASLSLCLSWSCTHTHSFLLSLSCSFLLSLSRSLALCAPITARLMTLFVNSARLGALPGA